MAGICFRHNRAAERDAEGCDCEGYHVESHAHYRRAADPVGYHSQQSMVADSNGHKPTTLSATDNQEDNADGTQDCSTPPATLDEDNGWSYIISSDTTAITIIYHGTQTTGTCTASPGGMAYCGHIGGIQMKLRWLIPLLFASLAHALPRCYAVWPSGLGQRRARIGQTRPRLTTPACG